MNNKGLIIAKKVISFFKSVIYKPTFCVEGAGAYFRKEFCVLVLNGRISIGLIFLEGGRWNLTVHPKVFFYFPRILFVCL